MGRVILMYMVGIILLFSSSLKLSSLFTINAWEVIPIDRWLYVSLLVVELGFASFLFFYKFPRAWSLRVICALGLFLFLAFSLYSWKELEAGRVYCACLGSLQVSSRVMIMLDLCCAAALGLVVFASRAELPKLRSCAERTLHGYRIVFLGIVVVFSISSVVFSSFGGFNALVSQKPIAFHLQRTTPIDVEEGHRSLEYLHIINPTPSELKIKNIFVEWGARKQRRKLTVPAFSVRRVPLLIDIPSADLVGIDKSKNLYVTVRVIESNRDFSTVFSFSPSNAG